MLSLFQFFGTVDPPAAIQRYDTAAGGGDSIGLLLFASNAVRLIAIIAGIFSFFNIIMAGFKYITSANDAKGVEQAWKSIYMSLIGLLIIVLAVAVTGVISWMLFGDATYILNPTIQGLSLIHI